MRRAVLLFAGLFAGMAYVPVAQAQVASPLAGVATLDLDTATVGRVMVHFADADRAHAEQLAELTEAAAAHFEKELGASFPLHLAVLGPGEWFDPWSADGLGQYGSPWGWVQDLLMAVPASLDQGVLIVGPDDEANLGRVRFVMLHEFGHLASKQYLHPESPRPYSSVKWFEEFLASYFAYAFIASTDPEWAEASRGEWSGFIVGYTPSVLSPLDWSFMRDLSPDEAGLTFAWYQVLLNLRAADVYEEHGLDFLRQVRDQLAWDQAAEWTSESTLSALEELAPGFAAWADDVANGDFLTRRQD